MYKPCAGGAACPHSHDEERREAATSASEAARAANDAFRAANAGKLATAAAARTAAEAVRLANARQAEIARAANARQTEAARAAAAARQAEYAAAREAEAAMPRSAAASSASTLLGHYLSLPLTPTAALSAEAAAWRAEKAPDGKPYYFNSTTRASQWEKPAGWCDNCKKVH